MKVGRLSETVLKRSVLKQIRHRRDEVIIGHRVGEAKAAIGTNDKHIITLTTNSITGELNSIGKKAIYKAANDVYCSGAELIGVILTIFLPESAKESEFRAMIQEIDGVCQELNAQVIKTDTHIMKSVSNPIMTVTGVGKVLKDELIKTQDVKASLDIVMTKWAGLEGSAIIAHKYEKELNTRYSTSFIDGAKGFNEYLSCIKEAKIAKDFKVFGMHSALEGGIYGALWEICASSNTGIVVDLRKIPLKQETVEICEFFDLNPYMLLSGGSILIATDNSFGLIEMLNDSNIEATVIGRTNTTNKRIVINEDESRFLEPPRGDELYKLLEKEL